MKHKHHITPKYRGGSNHRDNLIELSVTQHAMFHFCNWQLWGRWEDYFAWKGLSGEIGKEEIVAEARKRGGEIGSPIGLATVNWLYHNDQNFRKRQIEHSRKAQKLGVELAKTEEARKKRKETFVKTKHQQGERNSQFGTMWITDGVKNRKIKKEDPIPEGYRKGRTLN
jgi:hypothetical protein